MINYLFIYLLQHFIIEYYYIIIETFYDKGVGVNLNVDFEKTSSIVFPYYGKCWPTQWLSLKKQAWRFSSITSLSQVFQ